MSNNYQLFFRLVTIAMIILSFVCISGRPTIAADNAVKKIGSVGDEATYEMTTLNYISYPFQSTFSELANGSLLHYNLSQGMKYVYKLISINKSSTGFYVF